MLVPSHAPLYGPTCGSIAFVPSLPYAGTVAARQSSFYRTPTIPRICPNLSFAPSLQHVIMPSHSFYYTELLAKSLPNLKTLVAAYPFHCPDFSAFVRSLPSGLRKLQLLPYISCGLRLQSGALNSQLNIKDIAEQCSSLRHLSIPVCVEQICHHQHYLSGLKSLEYLYLMPCGKGDIPAGLAPETWEIPELRELYVDAVNGYEILLKDRAPRLKSIVATECALPPQKEVVWPSRVAIERVTHFQQPLDPIDAKWDVSNITSFRLFQQIHMGSVFYPCLNIPLFLALTVSQNANLKRLDLLPFPLSTESLSLLTQLPYLKKLKLYGDRSNYDNPNLTSVISKFPCLEYVDLDCYNSNTATAITRLSANTLKGFKWQMLACPADAMSGGISHWKKLNYNVVDIIEPLLSANPQVIEQIDLGTDSIVARGMGGGHVKVVPARKSKEKSAYRTDFMEHMMDVVLNLLENRISMKDARAKEDANLMLAIKKSNHSTFF